uniref:Retrovirus-related Pol polyprotein from transposon TNT 1-94-like beta-barrel domain-containing protein n=1 Tax=Cannabis sativa TaxID=3483 RepID=A0A803NPW7_CANSA
MTFTRFEVDKFNGTNDFGLWRIKMKAYLVHQGILEAIDQEELPALGEDKKKIKKVQNKAHKCHITEALKAKLQRDKSKERGDVGVVTDGYESADVLVVSSQESGDSLILDSRCSFHMIPRRELFDSFKKLDGGSVLLGDNKAWKVAEIGTVRIKFHDDQVGTIQDFMYVPDLKRNLLSIGELIEKRHTIKIDIFFKVMKGSLVVMK